VRRKKVTAAFDGGRITSDGGVMLLGVVEKAMGIAGRLASLITDRRNPLLVTHSVADILRARVLAIACGYEDADDLDHLRTDPGFKATTKGLDIRYVACLQHRHVAPGGDAAADRHDAIGQRDLPPSAACAASAAIGPIRG
jgi:hypothetical protein